MYSTFLMVIGVGLGTLTNYGAPPILSTWRLGPVPGA